ncbi:EAL domain-containing protein [Altericroceibacterium endophyticum]|uniref:EAL domain-containing protein n=1 Tax=Altericroceibacterium endophyticum TaxID=1808508 RepID=A0A6I4T3F3_9SPHN|nr:EAL domain-containing protein [Altericroceibacterium endophyticum]MXO64789.1 EAL domain-containing protein [Altericroceibacterium endophyticum]
MPPHDEENRLDALYSLNLLDTAPSESFDRITRMAAQLFNLPIAAVSLTDRDRQWFKSRVGIDHWSIPRFKAPCAQVAESARTLIVPDLLADSSYRNSLLADQGIRFYAGASLTTRDGYGLGSLCVLGTEPRQASSLEMNALSDLAKMVMSQIELQHAFGRIDPLSGLPNRTQFLDDLADLGRDDPGQRRLAVLVDLARPEQLDNGLRVMGATFMDQVVKDAARAISAAIGRERTAYHVSATQFAFLAPHDARDDDYMMKLRSYLTDNHHRLVENFITSASVGVAPFVTDETAPGDVLRTAHSAAQDARSCSAMVSMYSSTMDNAHQRRFRLLSDFSKALKNDEELALVYQPRIDLKTGKCVGAEALLRWKNPDLGPVSPAEFIPVIEQTTLAAPATKWVLKTALSQLSQWLSSDIALRISINLSASNLEEPDFAQEVCRLVAEHGIPPDYVELEVTESAIMGNLTGAAGQLRELIEAGMHVAIDDFGTGYSSLAYLQKLPGKILKIDQSFIGEMEADGRCATLVQSMISMAHDLGYRVVAEGVESPGARDSLIKMGCDEAQGYYYARPMAPNAFNRWLSQYSPQSEQQNASAA